MRQEEFENQLRKRIRKQRLIEGAVTAFLLVMGIVSWSLREATKEVVIHEGALFIPGWEEVNYNNAYVPFIVMGLVCAVIPGSFLLVDLLMCRFETVHKDLHDITLYRGVLHNIVYVDGIEKGRIEPFSYTNVVETRLPSNVKITVSFQRGILYLAHISFSDDTASMQV